MKNKGYTLVELLVAVALLLVVMAEVGALMINSQNIYSHGFYEVNLQEEAQQVVQQLEDLMMAATTDVQYTTIKHNGIDSDVITILTAEPELSGTGVPTGNYLPVEYKIGLSFDVNKGDGTLPGGGTLRSDADYGTDEHKYESLIMSKAVNGGTPTYVTMAESVRSLRVYVTKATDPTTGDVTEEYLQNYKEGNYVTLYLEMQNEQYYYKTDTSAHSIYLRNMPGKPVEKPTVSTISGGGNNDKVVNVLREHEFDLHDYVGDDYVEFKWKETNGSTAKYTLGTTSGKLECVSSLNSNWSDEVPVGNCVILATTVAGDYTDSVEIQMYTEKVSFKNMPLYIYDNMTAAASSVFPVSGICVCDSCVKQHNIIPVMVLGKFPGASDAIQLDADNNWGCKKDYDCKVSPTPSPAVESILWAGLDSSITTANIGDASMDTVAIPQSGIMYYSTYTLKSGGTKLSNGGDLGIDYILKDNKVNYLNLGGGNATYSYKTLTTHDANCVVMHTQTHLSTDAQAYWDKVVDAGEGFCGFRFRLKWDSGTSPDFYGYWYPQQSGTAAQHDMIMNRIATVYTGDEGTEYNFVVTTPTAYPTPPLGPTGAAADAVLESGGVALSSDTEGTVTIKNTGTADSGNSWSFTVDAGELLESISCSVSGYSLSCSGSVIKVTSYTNLPAGTDVTLAFTYSKKGAPAVIESAGVTLTSDTAGVVKVSNTGGSESEGSWTINVDTGVQLESVNCSTSGYNMSCSGTVIKINGYNKLAAGASVDLSFTYQKKPEPLVIAAGGYTLSNRNHWDGNTQYNVAFTNTSTNKVSSITVTMHVTAGTVNAVGGGCTGSVSGDTVTVTFSNWGNGIDAGSTVSTNVLFTGTGDMSVN